MASDRATLANVLERLKDASALLRDVRSMVDPVEGITHYRITRRILCAQMDINYCEGRILGLLAEPLPPIVDAVDEASAELGETWD